VTGTAPVSPPVTQVRATTLGANVSLVSGIFHDNHVGHVVGWLLVAFVWRSLSPPPANRWLVRRGLSAGCSRLSANRIRAVFRGPGVVEDDCCPLWRHETHCGPKHFKNASSWAARTPARGRYVRVLQNLLDLCFCGSENSNLAKIISYSK
jgi:hypothetical protein